MAASPTADVAAINGNRSIWLWNFPSPIVTTLPSKACSNAFLPNGVAVFLGDGDSLQLYPIDTQQQPRIFGSSLGWVRRAAVSADGRHAASGHGNAGNSPARPNDNYSVRLWDVKDAELLARFDGFKHSVWGLALRPTTGGSLQ